MRPAPRTCRRLRWLALLAAASLLGTACTDSSAGDQLIEPSPTASAAVTPSPADPAPSPTEATPSPVAASGLPEDELVALGVNELGRIPVIEWHKIADVDGRWENSLTTFKAQVQELCDRGYRPISEIEFIEGTFDIPAGYSPVILTFDDSYKEHFFFGPDGQTPDPNSAVGILQAMEQTCEDWEAHATFAFYWPVPFRETDRALIERKLNWLVDNGYDLSNHTYNHDLLRGLPDEKVIESIGRHETELAAVVGDDYRVRSITLTQGIWPDNRELAITGTYQGFTYRHDIAYEVGFMPTRSPHHVEYDPHSVQRVQAFVEEFDKWMAWLDEDRSRRFISDGDPTTVTYPASWADVAAPQEGFAVRTYGPAGEAPAG